jgi:hypothetical protein
MSGMLDIHLFWPKDSAWFDIWSIEHFISGMSIGIIAIGINAVIYRKKKWFSPQDIVTRYFDIIFLLFIAYFWETLEHYLELWYFGSSLEHWFHGVEFIWNLMVLWYLLIKKYSSLVLFARIFSLVWLTLHIFIFPHSMYLHDVLF